MSPRWEVQPLPASIPGASRGLTALLAALLGPEAQSTSKLGSEALDIIQPEAPKFLLLIEFFLPETLRPKIEKAPALLEDVRGNLPLLRGLWKPGLKSLLWCAPNRAGNPAASVYHQNHLTSPQGGA